MERLTAGSTLWLLLVVASVVGCEEAGKLHQGSAQQRLALGFGDAKLEFSGWQDEGEVKASLDALACWQAKVAGLSAVLCEFADAEKARAAQSTAVEESSGDTAIILPRGAHLLVVADPDGLDPKGKLFNQVAGVFRAQVATEPVPVSAPAKPADSAK